VSGGACRGEALDCYRCALRPHESFQGVFAGSREPLQSLYAVMAGQHFLNALRVPGLRNSRVPRVLPPLLSASLLNGILAALHVPRRKFRRDGLAVVNCRPVSCFCPGAF